MALPTNIQVREEWQGAARSVRYSLPRRTIPPVADTLVGLAVAIGAPFFFGGYATYSYFSAESQPSVAYLVVLALMGAVVCAVAAAAVVQLMFSHWGRYEIVVEGEQLRVTDSCGPWSWTRRIPLRNLRGLRIQIREEPPQPKFATLFLDDQHGTNWKICGEYDRDWLAEFADELLVACTPERADRVQSTVTQENPDASQYDARFSQPSSSTARVSRTVGARGREVSVILPAVGFRRCMPLASMAICLFLVATSGWVLFHLTRIVGLTLASDRPALNVSVGFAALGLLFAITLLRLASWISAARRHALLEWDDEELRFTELNWFRTRCCRWNPADLQPIQLVQFRAKDDSGVVVRAALVITTVSGKRQEILSWRPRAELEWLTTGIQQWQMNRRPPE